MIPLRIQAVYTVYIHDMYAYCEFLFSLWSNGPDAILASWAQSEKRSVHVCHQRRNHTSREEPCTADRFVLEWRKWRNNKTLAPHTNHITYNPQTKGISTPLQTNCKSLLKELCCSMTKKRRPNAAVAATETNLKRQRRGEVAWHTMQLSLKMIWSLILEA